MTGTCIFSILMSKFGYQQKFGPIILFNINKNLKIFLYYQNMGFNLTICSQIKSDLQLPLDIIKVVQLKQKFGGKKQAFIVVLLCLE